MTAFRPTAGLILLLAATSPAAAQTPGAPAEAKPDAVIEAVPGGGSTAAPTTLTPDDAKGVSGEDAAATTAPVSPDASAATQTAPAASAADAAQAGTGPADTAAGPEKAEPASADDKADAKAEAGAGDAPPGASGSSAATGDSAAAGGSTAADAPTAPDGDSNAAASPGDRASEQTDAKPAGNNADAGQAPAPAPQASEGAPAPSTAEPDVAQPGNAAPTTPADAAPAPAAAAVRQEPEEPPAPPAPPPAPKLAVQTGGGAFAQAYQQVVLAPFSEETGVEITEAPDDGSAGDLLLLDSAELARRCSKGDLLSLEVSELVPSSGSMRDDFLDGALKPCGIAALAWSNVFAFDPARFAKRIPARAADVFDVRRFPGKRALPADGRGLIEAVLVADGVAPGDVYATLATSDGIGRVVKRLKSLGDNIVWYNHLPEAIALVRAGKAAIALTSNGHAFMEQARSGPLGLIWDGQVLHASYFAVPKDTSDAAQAKKLVAFAARPEKLASLVRQIPYGPMRHSAVAGATGLRHAVTGQELADFLPTAPENLKGAVRFDAAWWDANADRMAGVLRTVRVGPPLPTRP